MRKFCRKDMFAMIVFVAIAWLLPQSLFYDCICPVVEVENEWTQNYSTEDYRRMFDVAEDECQITFEVIEWIKGFQAD